MGIRREGSTLQTERAEGATGSKKTPPKKTQAKEKQSPGGRRDLQRRRTKKKDLR